MIYMPHLIVENYLYGPWPTSYREWLHSWFYTLMYGTMHGLDSESGSRKDDLEAMIMGGISRVMVQGVYLGAIWLFIAFRFYGGFMSILVDVLGYVSYPNGLYNLNLELGRYIISDSVLGTH